MFTKLFLFIKQFPSWFKTLKTENRYLYFGIWTHFILFFALIFNFLTFREFTVYSIIMALIPSVWTLGHILYLGVVARKQKLNSINHLKETILLPHSSSFITDTMTSFFILFIASGFDGSQNDFIYLLILVFFIKLGLSLLIRKFKFRGFVYLDMILLILSLLLTLTLYSLAVTV